MQYMENPQIVNRQMPDDTPYNKPPFNLDVEQGLLGTLMAWNDSVEDVAPLTASHFFAPIHGRIFDLIAEHARAGRKATPVTLAPLLEHEYPVDAETTAVQYLVKLSASATARSSMKDYARLIIDLAIRRSLMVAGEDLAYGARLLSDTVSPQVLIEETEARLFELAEGSRTEAANTLTFDDAVASAIDRATSGEVTGLSTGLVDLDAKLGGLFPTDLVILAGRPSMGKTALATDIAVAVAGKKTPVGFFSMEMSAEQLAMRVLAQRAEISSVKFRNGGATQGQFAKLGKAKDSLQGLPIWIDKTGGLTIAQLSARARRMKRKHGVGLIVIDYLQLMQAGSGRRESRVQDITEITTGLKAMAKELDIPVVALSQLSRNVEHRPDKRPQLSDLRESGSIEQDADVVMFVFREDYYIEREEPAQGSPDYVDWQRKLAAATGKAEVIIGKQRHGAVGAVKLAFNSELTRFADLARQEVRHGL